MQILRIVVTVLDVLVILTLFAYYTKLAKQNDSFSIKADLFFALLFAANIILAWR